MLKHFFGTNANKTGMFDRVDWVDAPNHKAPFNQAVCWPLPLSSDEEPLDPFGKQYMSAELSSIVELDDAIKGERRWQGGVAALPLAISDKDKLAAQIAVASGNLTEQFDQIEKSYYA